MRIMFAVIPLLVLAAPVAAATPPQRPQPTDPAMADRVADAMQAVSKAMLDLPVGELQAAVEGRQPTLADRQRKVRDLDPDLQAQVAQARPVIRQSVKALSDALPAVVKSLQEAQKSLERAEANMPDPTYPKR
jgi:hypothetical protein